MNKANPNIKIRKLMIRLILKKKWIKVIINEIIINPKNISKKKLFFFFKFISFPYPEIDNEKKIILTKKRSIWRKSINYYLLKFLIVLFNASEKFILNFQSFLKI